MTKIQVHQDKITDFGAIEKLCPFGALEIKEKSVEIGTGCRACLLCVKKGPPGAFTLAGNSGTGIDKTIWRGITVYAELGPAGILPVSLELIGKARLLAEKIGQPVSVIVVGNKVETAVLELMHYGVDAIYVYENPEFEHFRVEPYAAALEDAIQTVRPRRFSCRRNAPWSVAGAPGSGAVRDRPDR